MPLANPNFGIATSGLARPTIELEARFVFWIIVCRYVEASMQYAGTAFYPPPSKRCWGSV